MGLVAEKCCCFIPLRLGTIFIALWFFVVYLLDAITGFLGINAIIVYSGLSAKGWYYADLVFTLIVCLGGLLGIFGSCFSSRKFISIFSAIVWVNCGLSIIKYLVSLVLMAVYRDDMVNSCMRSGFIGASNAQTPFTRAPVSDSQFYSPVKYPGTLNANATSHDACETSIRSFLIAYGIVVFFIEVLQLYFAVVVSAYKSRLRNGARHHRLHDQQIKDFEDSRHQMATVY